MEKTLKPMEEEEEKKSAVKDFSSKKRDCDELTPSNFVLNDDETSENNKLIPVCFITKSQSMKLAKRIAHVISDNILIS